MRRKPSEAALRSAERRRLEDAAERLAARVPGLATLEIAIEEGRTEADVGANKYVRRIVVERAPALFDWPCAEPRCRDGGHDVTSSVMAALLRKQARFTGEHTCNGTNGSAPCGRVLRYVATATWRT